MRARRARPFDASCALLNMRARRLQRIYNKHECWRAFQAENVLKGAPVLEFLQMTRHLWSPEPLMRDVRRWRIALYASAPTAAKFAINLRLSIEELMQSAAQL